MEEIVELGLVGLGKMGANMSQRLKEKDIKVVGFDVNPAISDVSSLKELVSKLRESNKPITLWLMLPMFAYDGVLSELTSLLAAGDMLIDGGNTRWSVTKERSEKFNKLGVHYVDVGTSGGIWGLDNGYAVMVGATKEEYQALEKVLCALAPKENGMVRAGPSGAGHFAKEVHNGIEYGIMASLAEGFELLSKENMIKDPVEVFASWRDGSVVKSWLLDLSVAALTDKESFAKIAAIAPDSGEGRWTVEDAIRLGVPLPVITAALYTRFSSQDKDSVAVSLIAAMRNQFGGHDVVKKASE